MSKKFISTIELAVRDYECDMQGIVNNAVYLNYLEHARHQYLAEKGIDFADYTARKIFLVLVRAEIDYKVSLRTHDRFVINTRIEKQSALRYVFIQDIYRLPDNVLVLSAKMTGTSLNEQGRPKAFKELSVLFNEE